MFDCGLYYWTILLVSSCLGVYFSVIISWCLPVKLVKFQSPVITVVICAVVFVAATTTTTTNSATTTTSVTTSTFTFIYVTPAVAWAVTFTIAFAVKLCCYFLCCHILLLSSLSKPEVTFTITGSYSHCHHSLCCYFLQSQTFSSSAVDNPTTFCCCPLPLLSFSLLLTTTANWTTSAAPQLKKTKDYLLVLKLKKK